MPLQKIQFKPGIDRENTNYANEGGWYDMDKVRFRSGTPQKIGGWVPKAKYSTTNYDLFYQGVARSIINWVSLENEDLIGVGTNLRYYVLYGGIYYNITPIRLTKELTDPFNTSAGSMQVTVDHTGHGAAINDFVIYSGTNSVGGISGSVFNDPVGFQVVKVLDVDTYVIDVGVAATTTATGGGTVTAKYEIQTGAVAYTYGTGWGAPVWNGAFVNDIYSDLAYTSGSGDGVLLDDTSTEINVVDTLNFTATGTILIDAELITYTGVTSTSFTGCTRGTGDTMAAYHVKRELSPGVYEPIVVRQVVSLYGTTGWGEGATDAAVGVQLRTWTNDNFGQDLLMAPRGGEIYHWVKDTSTFARAAVIRDGTDPVKKFVPVATNQIVVSDVSRFAIAMGANSYDPLDANTVFDTLLVRWSDQEDCENWVPSITNQAGEQRLSNGSAIMTSAKMKQEILIWTDTALYSMQYVGPPYVWSITPNMSNLSIISPNAVATVNNTAFWMGVDKFYMYNGRVDTLPCSLRQYVFSDISNDQKFQTFAGTSEGYHEIWWFYCSANSSAVDRYVIYNYLENIWYYGTLNRTAWLDSPIQVGPLAAYPDMGTSVSQGRLLVHEQGNDDVTTDSTQPLPAYIQSTDFDIGDGDRFMFVWRMLPDMSFVGSTVQTPGVVVSLIPRQNSGAPYGTAVPSDVVSNQSYSHTVKSYTVQEFTQQVYVRVRGRQMAMRVESSGVGVQWQLGAMRIDSRTDGQKS